MKIFTEWDELLCGFEEQLGFINSVSLVSLDFNPLLHILNSQSAHSSVMLDNSLDDGERSSVVSDTFDGISTTEDLYTRTSTKYNAQDYMIMFCSKITSQGHEPGKTHPGAEPLAVGYLHLSHFSLSADTTHTSTYIQVCCSTSDLHILTLYVSSPCITIYRSIRNP
jgi:hypothetical protein